LIWAIGGYSVILISSHLFAGQAMKTKNDSPFNRGFAAFLASIPRDWCPYRKNSRERENWDAGWDYARASVSDANDRRPAETGAHYAR
jgi:ribosome modulation factor